MASLENAKVYYLAQHVNRQDDSLTSQAQSVDSQALARVQVNHPGPACRSGSVSSPVITRSRSTTSNLGRGDLDSLYGVEIFSLELDNEAAPEGEPGSFGGSWWIFAS